MFVDVIVTVFVAWLCLWFGCLAVLFACLNLFVDWLCLWIGCVCDCGCVFCLIVFVTVNVFFVWLLYLWVGCACMWLVGCSVYMVYGYCACDLGLLSVEWCVTRVVCCVYFYGCTLGCDCV